MVEKFEENLKDAVKSLQIADHITYVTYPIVNEKRLLIKVFDEIHKSISNCINAMLNYEAHLKRIKLYGDNRANMQLFIDKVAERYNLTPEHLRKILEIMNIHHIHKQSSMEFVKKEKVVILSDSLNTKTLDIIKIKEYLMLAKEILMKTNQKIQKI